MSSNLILDASPPTDQEWEEYKIKFSKKYNDADHESSKRAIFTEGKKKVAEHNQKHEKGEVTYTMGINQFTDMTEDEMKCMRGHGPRWKGASFLSALSFISRDIIRSWEKVS